MPKHDLAWLEKQTRLINVRGTICLQAQTGSQCPKHKIIWLQTSTAYSCPKHSLTWIENKIQRTNARSTDSLDLHPLSSSSMVESRLDSPNTTTYQCVSVSWASQPSIQLRTKRSFWSNAVSIETTSLHFQNTTRTFCAFCRCENNVKNVHTSDPRPNRTFATS